MTEPEQILWTDALEEITTITGDENQARLILGTLLDGDLELPQTDNEERVITQSELDRIKQLAREEAQ